MELIKADIWDFYDRGAWIGVTTNGVVKANGELVMGAGIAKQAARRFPWLPQKTGALLRHHRKNIPCLWQSIRLVTFPTKYDWWANSDPDLIERSAANLRGILWEHPEITAEQPLYLAAPGTGLGGLTWGKVKPLLKVLEGLNVVCVTLKDEV